MTVERVNRVDGIGNEEVIKKVKEEECFSRRLSEETGQDM